MVCCYKKNKVKSSISKIVVNDEEFSEPIDICNQFNHYFCHIGENLVATIPKYHGKQLNFMNYCKPSIQHSMVCEAIDRDESINQSIIYLYQTNGPYQRRKRYR